MHIDSIPSDLQACNPTGIDSISGDLQACIPRHIDSISGELEACNPTHIDSIPGDFETCMPKSTIGAEIVTMCCVLYACRTLGPLGISASVFKIK